MLALNPAYNCFLESIQATRITVEGYLFRVEFGPGVSPRYHHVDRAYRCACDLGVSCPAALAVIEHVSAGGAVPEEPPEGYFPTVPNACPICGAPCAYVPGLNSPRRGLGWRCLTGGANCYWRCMAQALAHKFAANPWLFPPVVIRQVEDETGETTQVQMRAWDGIEPGDQVLYAGLLRSEIVTAPTR